MLGIYEYFLVMLEGGVGLFSFLFYLVYSSIFTLFRILGYRFWLLMCLCRPYLHRGLRRVNHVQLNPGSETYIVV